MIAPALLKSNAGFVVGACYFQSSRRRAHFNRALVLSGLLKRSGSECHKQTGGLCWKLGRLRSIPAQAGQMGMNGAKVVAVLNRVMMIPVILCMMTAGMVRRNATDERPAGVDGDGPKLVVDQSLRNV